MSFSRARSGRLFGAGAVMTAAFLAMSVAPAQASSMFFSKSSGRTASVQWLEMGELPGVVGNVHTGYLFVEELSRGSANVFGGVTDWTCPDGVLPGHGGGHGEFEEEPEGPQCTHEGERWIEGGDVAFTMDRKFSSATLTGTLNVVGGHDGQVLGTPRVNITWIGVGDLYKSTESGRYSDGTSSYSYRYSFSGRDAVIAEGSRIGVMIFDDEPGEFSFAEMGAYREASRERTR